MKIMHAQQNAKNKQTTFTYPIDFVEILAVLGSILALLAEN